MENKNLKIYQSLADSETCNFRVCEIYKFEETVSDAGTSNLWKIPSKLNF